MYAFRDQVVPKSGCKCPEIWDVCVPRSTFEILVKTHKGILELWSNTLYAKLDTTAKLKISYMQN